MDSLFYFFSIFILLLTLGFSTNITINSKRRIYCFLLFPTLQVLIFFLTQLRGREVKSDFTLTVNYEVWLWQIALLSLILSLTIILSQNTNTLTKQIFKVIIILVFFAMSLYILLWTFQINIFLDMNQNSKTISSGQIQHHWRWLSQSRFTAAN